MLRVWFPCVCPTLSRWRLWVCWLFYVLWLRPGLCACCKWVWGQVRVLVFLGVLSIWSPSCVLYSVPSRYLSCLCLWEWRSLCLTPVYWDLVTYFCLSSFCVLFCCVWVVVGVCLWCVSWFSVSSLIGKVCWWMSCLRHVCLSVVVLQWRRLLCLVWICPSLVSCS